MITTCFYDPAAGETKQHDYKAIVLGSMVKGIYTVRWAWIKQEKTTNDVLEEMYRIDAEYPGVHQGFETNGFQRLYKELLKNKAEKKGYPIRTLGINSVGSKFTRIENLAGFIEDGYIRFLYHNGYPGDIGLLIEQLIEFPNGSHDDGPDALAYAFMMAKDKAMKAAYGQRRGGRQSAEGGKQKAESRKQKAEGKKRKGRRMSGQKRGKRPHPRRRRIFR